MIDHVMSTTTDDVLLSLIETEEKGGEKRFLVNSTSFQMHARAYEYKTKGSPSSQSASKGSHIFSMADRWQIQAI